MNQQQFRVLYREFLFRMVDLEVLSSQGDIKDLLGQFGGILVYFSSLVSLGAMFFDTRRMTPAAAVAAIWSIEHFLISTTMLVMGLFAVLSWDSTFPDRRDVLVLAPLPIRPRTVFLAKAAALGAALALTTAALNGLPGIVWGLLIFPPPHSGLLGPFRTLAAYWISALAGAAFLFCGVLAVQGMAGQLPRRWYLRVSAVLQIATFCLILGTYCLEPSLSTPQAFAASQNQHLLAWLPSYWFLGLFHALNGSATPGVPAAAWRAVLGLMAAGLLAGTAYLLAYFRTLRKIVEEPDIVPGAHGVWLPRFGKSPDTALVQFSIRTLLRSRQHRIILAFYLGIGFAILILLVHVGGGPAGHARAAAPAPPVTVPRMLASVLMLAFWVLGTRVAFSVPLEMRANWIFRVIPLGGPPACLKAGRRALLALSVAPLWVLSAAVYLWLWPWRPVLAHLLVLGLLGVVICEACLQNFRKIPFACSFLPGKSRVHMAVLGVWPLIAWSAMGVAYEWHALDHPADYAKIIAVLVAAASVARWNAARLAKSEEAAVVFEEAMPPTIQTLGLSFEASTPVNPPVAAGHGTGPG
jgi:hypothetical protein